MIVVINRVGKKLTGVATTRMVRLVLNGSAGNGLTTTGAATTGILGGKLSVKLAAHEKSSDGDNRHDDDCVKHSIPSKCLSEINAGQIENNDVENQCQVVCRHNKCHGGACGKME